MEGTTAKIHAKTFIPWLLNQFYGIHISSFSTLEVIFSRSKVPLPSYGRKGLFAGFESGFTGLAVLLLALWGSLRAS